jgi:hypothetical protein
LKALKLKIGDWFPSGMLSIGKGIVPNIFAAFIENIVLPMFGQIFRVDSPNPKRLYSY